MGSSEESTILTQMEQDMDALSHMHYTANYSTDINTKMQIPDRISMAADNDMPSGLITPPDTTEEQIINSPANSMMNVPDRIIVGGSNSHMGLKQGPMTMNLDDITPFSSVIDDHLGLKTPPHTLTLEDYNFPTAGNESKLEDTPTRGQKQNRNALSRNDSLQMTSLESAPTVDIQTLQRHISLLNRKVAILEHENANRDRNDMYLYSLLLIYALYKGARFLKGLF